MGKIKKQAVIAQPLQIPKEAKYRQEDTSTNHTPISWRVTRLQLVDPFGWHTLSHAKLLDVLAKLAEFEKLTWNEILVERQKQNHSVQVTQLCSEAQKRLAEINLDDIEQLVSLRLSGKERVWGMREGAVLLLLWWDPEHQVCPSLLKNT